MKKKLLAIGIIFLFIGVAVAPSINSTIAKASNENDLVEVTSQACGVQGFGNTTVKLTKEQYQDLEQYLVDFRARLNQTTTREEAVPIFKDAVVELDKFGLLPKGMSIQQAQNLVTLSYRIQENRKVSNLLRKSLNNTNIDNAFCLVGGYLSTVEFQRLLGWYTWLFLIQIYGFFYPYLWYFVVSLIPLMASLIVFRFLFPVSLGVCIGFGGAGFLSTLGILGLKSWKGYIQGGFTRTHDLDGLPFGIIGFTGIHIFSFGGVYPPEMGSFILGSALAVGVDAY
jgi:hypothetical protein